MSKIWNNHLLIPLLKRIEFTKDIKSQIVNVCTILHKYIVLLSYTILCSIRVEFTHFCACPLSISTNGDYIIIMKTTWYYWAQCSLQYTHTPRDATFYTSARSRYQIIKFFWGWGIWPVICQNSGWLTWVEYIIVVASK